MSDSSPLNRGISQLIDTEEDYSFTFSNTPTGQQSIAIETIYPNPDQPRKQFSDQQLQELCDSIKRKGVLQPILVRPHPFKDNAHEIVAGERRWQASTKAGLDQIPAIIKELSDADVIEIALIENIHRQDLTPIEEAAGYKVLIDQFDYTQEKLASIVSRSRSHIANSLRLLTLPPSIQEMLNNNTLSAGHARALVGHDNAESMAKSIADLGLSVRQTELFAQTGEIPTDTPKTNKIERTTTKAPLTNPNIATLERQLSEKTGLKVRIKNNGEKGSVTLHYTSFTEFERISKHLHHF